MKKLLSLFLSLILLFTPVFSFAEEEEPVSRDATVYSAVTISSFVSNSESVTLSWPRSTSNNGFKVFRKADEEDWAYIGSRTNNDTSFTDKSAKPGVMYTYKVLSFTDVTIDSAEEDPAEDPANVGDSRAKSYMFLAPPREPVLSRSGTSMTVTWGASEGASSYTLSYSTNSMFTGAKTVTVDGNEAVLNGLDAAAAYYVRVRANCEGYTSYWSHSGNIKAVKAKVSYVKSGTKKLDIRKKAKQKLYQYDTVQGSTSDGTYSYTILLNKRNNRCRIVKMKAGTSKVIKVSGVLNLGHGNDMAYNPVTKRLVVAHGKSTKRTISVINPDTLKRTKKVTVSIPDKISGISLKTLQSKPYFAGISYVPGTDEYALKATSLNIILYLDKNFKLKRAVRLSMSPANLGQNSHVTEDYIYRITSPSSKKAGNIIYAYDRAGLYLGNIVVPVPGELEGIYFVGNKLFGSIYRSRFITIKKKITKYYKKTIKVKGKKKKVRRKKKVTKKYRIFYRDSYVVRITSY